MGLSCLDKWRYGSGRNFPATRPSHSCYKLGFESLLEDKLIPDVLVLEKHCTSLALVERVVHVLCSCVCGDVVRSQHMWFRFLVPGNGHLLLETPKLPVSIVSVPQRLSGRYGIDVWADETDTQGVRFNIGDQWPEQNLINELWTGHLSWTGIMGQSNLARLQFREIALQWQS